MMLIDADKLHLKLLDIEFPIQDQDPILDAMDDCTVDAAPVVHGRWVNEDFPENLATVHDMAQCSVCGELSHKAEHGYAILSKFCPNCGAKMGLPKDGEQMAVLKKFRKSKKALMAGRKLWDYCSTSSLGNQKRNRRRESGTGWTT